MKLASLFALFALGNAECQLDFDMEGKMLTREIVLSQIAADCNEANNVTSIYVLNASLPFDNENGTLFEGLFQVQELAIWYSPNLQLSSRLLEDQDKLKTIMFEHNNMPTSFPADFFSQTPFVETLMIQYNNLTSIPPTLFAGMGSYLKFLYLDSNLISEFSAEQFIDLRWLETLILDNNTLTTLPVGILNSDLARLVYFSIEYNPLLTYTLPRNFFENVTSITDIHLDGTPLQFAPDFSFVSEGSSSYIETISMSNMGLSSIPATMFANRLDRLTTITLENNLLTEIPENAFGCASSPSAVCQNLVMLMLDYNPLTSLHALAFEGMTYLETLGLQSTNLRSINGQFLPLTNLKNLYLSNTPSLVLEPTAFASQSLLINLDLENCGLTSDLAGIFDPLINLRQLNLRNNLLTTLAETSLFGLTLLSSLDLEFNRLTTLPSQLFNGNVLLTQLLLNNQTNVRGTNSLSSLPLGLFDPLSILGTLDMDTPPRCEQGIDDTVRPGSCRSIYTVDFSGTRTMWGGYVLSGLEPSPDEPAGGSIGWIIAGVGLVMVGGGFLYTRRAKQVTLNSDSNAGYTPLREADNVI